tara:strand:- start:969 stop:1256 length:288 start_codon:yes stop_codon:yes gene_type:complete
MVLFSNFIFRCFKVSNSKVSKKTPRDEKEMNDVNCSKCLHFYVTYKPRFPYGCKAFGIISRKNPYLEIRSISGTNCALFQKRKKNVNIKKKGRLA